MALRDEINGLTPRLRRYARALATGGSSPSALGDEVVQATLMRALGARHIGASSDLVVRLFATVTQLHREMAVAGGEARAASVGRPSLVASRSTAADLYPARRTRLSVGLSSLPVEEREALLLVALEGFDHAEAARILRVSRAVLISRLSHARTALEGSLRAAPAQATRSAPHLRIVK